MVLLGLDGARPGASELLERARAPVSRASEPLWIPWDPGAEWGRRPRASGVLEEREALFKEPAGLLRRPWAPEARLGPRQRLYLPFFFFYRSWHWHPIKTVTQTVTQQSPISFLRGLGTLDTRMHQMPWCLQNVLSVDWFCSFEVTMTLCEMQGTLMPSRGSASASNIHHPPIAARTLRKCPKKRFFGRAG